MDIEKYKKINFCILNNKHPDLIINLISSNLNYCEYKKNEIPMFIKTLCENKQYNYLLIFTKYVYDFKWDNVDINIPLYLYSIVDYCGVDDFINIYIESLSPDKFKKLCNSKHNVVLGSIRRKKKCYDQIEILFKKGANPNFNFDDGKDYLDILLIENFDINYVNILLKYGYKINDRAERYLIFFCKKISIENAEKIKFLLDLGADPNVYDVDTTFTPLMLLLSKFDEKYLDIIKELIKKSNLNYKNNLSRGYDYYCPNEYKFLLKKIGRREKILNDMDMIIERMKFVATLK